ncbi:MAG: 6,7-dimethyl-8-ribityllumazine synthase [Acidimicrobiia bacterium]
MGRYTAYEGNLDATGMRMAVVAGRFNDSVTKPLLEGALDGLREHGLDSDEVSVVWVPGAYEIPLVAQRLAGSSELDAVICLGAVIRGGTPHFDYVAGQCAAGVTRVALDTGVPVIFGVLTTDDVEQAMDRAGGSEGNKGREAALTAIEMVDLLRQLPGARGTR